MTFNPLWDPTMAPETAAGLPSEANAISPKNLSEYFGEITTKAQNTIEQQVGTKIDQYFNRTR